MTAAPISDTAPVRVRTFAAEVRSLWMAYGPKCGWALVASAISQIQSLGLTLITARTLAGDDFGGFTLIFGTLSMAISIATLSLGLTATRCVAATHANADAMARSLAVCRRMAALSGTIAMLALIGLAAPVAGFVRAGGLELALRIGAPYVFFMTVNAYQTGALAGLLAFRESMEINAIQLVIGIPVTLGLTNNFGPAGATAALSLCGFSTWAHSEIVLRSILRKRGVAVSRAPHASDFRSISAIAIPASLAAVLASIALWGLTVVSSRQPGGVALAGTFAIASNLRLATLFVPVVLQRVLAAHLSRAEYWTNRGRYERLYRRGVLASVALTAVAGAAVFAMRAPLLSVFGHNHRVDDSFLAALLVSGLAESYATAAYQTIATIGSLALHAMVILAWCPVLVGGAWFAAQRHWGGPGMAASLLAAWTVSSIAYSLISKRLINGIERISR